MKPEEMARVNRLVAQNLGRKMTGFTPVLVACPQEIEAEENGQKVVRICGSRLWDTKTVHNIFYVPQVVCQESGGAIKTRPHIFFMCVACGYLMGPDEWRARAIEAFEAKDKAIITPEEMQPENNGKE